MDIIKNFDSIIVDTEEVLDEHEPLFLKLCSFLEAKDMPYSFVYDEDNVNAVMVFFRSRQTKNREGLAHGKE